MQTLTRGNFVTVGLRAGQSITLSGDGVIVALTQTEPGESVTFRDWPVTVGPLTVDRDFRVTALGGSVSYSISVPERTDAQVVRVLSADLPEYGQTGVIYETEEGWRRWDELTGVFLAMDAAPAFPAQAAGEDTAPVIAGDAEIGATLSVVSNGVWDNRPTSFSYQWYYEDESDVAIEGATGSSYVVDASLEGESIYCAVTGTNAVDDAETAAVSNSIGPIVDPGE